MDINKGNVYIAYIHIASCQVWHVTAPTLKQRGEN